MLVLTELLTLYTPHQDDHST